MKPSSSLGIGCLDLSPDFKSELPCCGHPQLHSGKDCKNHVEANTFKFGDCISCSGSSCVADTPIFKKDLSAQEQFEAAQAESINRVVVSLSDQSRASLAVHFGVSHEEIYSRLKAFFQLFGVKHVFDIAFARAICFEELTKEFIERKKGGLLPLLVSSCPGFISYAETLHSDYLLPYISTTRSPQQVMGRLIKSYFATSNSIDAKNIYHVSVMPCLDKKTEARRFQFYDDGRDIRDVDLVFTTEELLAFIKAKEVDFLGLAPVPLDDYLTLFDPSTQLLYGSRGSPSGGYLEHVLTEASERLCGVRPTVITYQPQSTSDLKIVEYQVDGKTVMKFGQAYGLRHIQSFMRAIKQKKSDFDFIEVMACPGGCTNGAAQITAATADERQQLLNKVNETYYSTSANAHPNKAKDFLLEWFQGDTIKIQQQLHTGYQKARVENPKQVLDRRVRHRMDGIPKPVDVVPVTDIDTPPPPKDIGFELPKGYVEGLTLEPPSEIHKGPINTCNWVLVGRVMAGAYPGDLSPDIAKEKLRILLEAGTTTFVCLQRSTELEKFASYFDLVSQIQSENPELKRKTEMIRFGIPDMGIPKSSHIIEFTENLVQRLAQGESLYIHCWGGHGRTGLVIGCLLGRLFPLTPEQSLYLTSNYHQQRDTTRGHTSPQSESQFRQVRKVVAYYRANEELWKLPLKQTSRSTKSKRTERSVSADPTLNGDDSPDRPSLSESQPGPARGPLTERKKRGRVQSANPPSARVMVRTHSQKEVSTKSLRSKATTTQTESAPAASSGRRASVTSSSEKSGESILVISAPVSLQMASIPENKIVSTSASEGAIKTFQKFIIHLDPKNPHLVKSVLCNNTPLATTLEKIVGNRNQTLSDYTVTDLNGEPITNINVPINSLGVLEIRFYEKTATAVVAPVASVTVVPANAPPSNPPTPHLPRAGSAPNNITPRTPGTPGTARRTSTSAVPPTPVARPQYQPPPPQQGKPITMASLFSGS